MTIDAKDIPFESDDGPQITSREFEPRGDRGYRMTFSPAGIQFEVDRLRRERHQLDGELIVRVNGSFTRAKAVEGMLTVGDFNFSSVQARTTRAKLLALRSGEEGIDWHGLLEEFCIRVVQAERQGPAPVELAKAVPDESSSGADEAWTVSGIPLLKDHPTVLFGDGGAGKSYLALYLAGCLAQMGVPVLYNDWEFSMEAHRRRYRALFQPAPEGLYYLRCERPMREEAERISKVISEKKIQYVINDSVGYACNHRPEDAENANEYFRAVRSFRIGSLNLGHISKQDKLNERSPEIFGSVFWRNGSRSMWYMKAASDNPEGEIRFGLYHHKYQSGRPLTPRAYRIIFGKEATSLEPIKLSDVEELAAGLPVLERVKRYLLNNGTQAVKTIADELGLTAAVVRTTINRHPDAFVKLDNKFAVKTAEGVEF